MNVVDSTQHAALFFHHLQRSNPLKNAVVDLSFSEPISLTFAQLDDLANRTAQGLMDRGVRSGDHVAYLLPNCWEFVVITLAVWKLGASACPMLPALREREIPFIMAKSKSPILIIPEEYRDFKYGPLIEKIKPNLPHMKSLITIVSRNPDDKKNCLGGLAANEYNEQLKQQKSVDYDTNAQLLFTSGTTGEPKGVVHTHGTLSLAIKAHVQALQLTREDIVWIPSPMAHQTGFLYGMILALYLGSTQVIQGKWNTDTARVAIEQFGATFVQAAMPFLSDLTRVDNPPIGLKVFVATGATVPRQLAYQASILLHCKVVGGWGSTEACLVTVGSPYNSDENPWDSDGSVIAGMKVKIVDEEGKVLPAGKEGLFKVQTPAMFKEYLDHPEWYKAAFDGEGYFNTGDLAFLDEKGHLHISGRTKDVINRGGVKIPVVELENMIYEHEAVREVAVVSMPDDRLNERICAYVVCKNLQLQLTLEQITLFLQDRGVTKIYWPEHLELIAQMPMTVTGKIQKYILRQWIAEKLTKEQELNR